MKNLESKTQFKPAKREKSQRSRSRKGKPFNIPKRKEGHVARAGVDQERTHLMTKAEITIAKYVRRMLVKIELFKWHSSATVIQRYWRGSRKGTADY